jgi:hypothetical protein
MQSDLGGHRRLIRSGDASEILNLSERFFVKALDVPAYQDVQWALHVNFHKLRNTRPDSLPHRFVWRYRGGDRNDTVAGEYCTNESDSADILLTIFLAETESFGETVTDQIAVEQFHLGALRSQPVCQQNGNRGLSGPRQSGNPNSEALVFKWHDRGILSFKLVVCDGARTWQALLAFNTQHSRPWDPDASPQSDVAES